MSSLLQTSSSFNSPMATPFHWYSSTLPWQYFAIFQWKTIHSHQFVSQRCLWHDYHRILFDTSYGITGFIKSYLSGHIVCPHRSRFSSSLITSCNMGVPQCFVLRPILLSLYTSQICCIASNCNICLQQYAYDTKLIFSATVNTPSLQFWALTHHTLLLVPQQWSHCHT